MTQAERLARRAELRADIEKRNAELEALLEEEARLLDDCEHTYGDGRVHVDFNPAEHFTGYTGVVHGGIIATVLDEILGWAISLQSDRFTYVLK